MTRAHAKNTRAPPMGRCEYARTTGADPQRGADRKPRAAVGGAWQPRSVAAHPLTLGLAIARVSFFCAVVQIARASAVGFTLETVGILMEGAVAESIPGERRPLGVATIARGLLPAACATSCALHAARRAVHCTLCAASGALEGLGVAVLGITLAYCLVCKPLLGSSHTQLYPVVMAILLFLQHEDEITGGAFDPGRMSSEPAPPSASAGERSR